jgi:rubrerythrin
MDKPSYLGLLNSIAVGEADGEELFCAWAAVTPDPDVKAVLETVMIREGEHAKSFAKRINELGYTVRPKDAPDHAARMAIASSTTLCDCDKFEQLRIGVAPKDGSDVFARFMDDLTIDIQTGQLMGRYIAEERDSNRMLQGCRAAVAASANGGDTDVEARLARIEQALEALLAKA